jgi:formiminotetrahydrofolate cyclodeaminase
MPVSSEIVGLIPKKRWSRRRSVFAGGNFDSSLILENRLAAVMGGKMAIGGLRAGVEPFVEQLAAPTATPGGGSAAAASGAMAAGLATMVASMSRGKKAYVQHEPELSGAIARLSQLREELKAAIDADAESYNAVMKAYKQARDSANADGIIDAALKQATNVPLSVDERDRELVGIVERLQPITNPNMKSDLTTATALARAAIQGALANVEINLESPERQWLYRGNPQKGCRPDSLTSGAMHLSWHATCPFVWPFCRQMSIQYVHKSHLNAHILRGSS